ncbi:hypothetical protein K432DRAFT_400840 [Lepidopterella palustris CBS 459.81]|uniref:THO complex subunit 2 n=1 Tax=Lepidopterella palustris CBS 459.81 TaxID=1314670 RepID=A0A8E2JJY6_9PEZI|nr:hypothetical protein K432DRAFT_400840 [Lepidopterella palustris CBS 459.81]
MAPSGKRKRADRTYSQDDNDGSSRASPHRPQDMSLAQRGQQNNARGGRRSSRGAGRGGSTARESPVSASNPQISPVTSKAMSPPPTNSASAKGTSNATSPVLLSNSTERPSTKTSASQTLHYFEYLSEDRITSWRGAGRKAVVDAAVHAQSESDALVLASIFQELVKASLEGLLDPTDAGSIVREVLGSPSASLVMDPISLFLDSVSILTEANTSHPSLKTLLVATGIDPNRMRSELETPLLIALPLVRPTFVKMAIRKGTHALYRQSAYNLLREESEGYSKLMTEYFTTVNSAPPSDVVVTDTFQRVKALIGAFDLDVGRVLDITLDVFANLLVKHYRFFIKLLRTSSWWPEQKALQGVEWVDQGFSSLPNWALPGCPIWHTTEEEKERLLLLREMRDTQFWERVREVGLGAYFELGSRRITSDISAFEMTGDTDAMETMSSKKKDEEIPDNDKIHQWTREWIVATRTLPPPGNRIAAQLLGFKLRFYASDARDPHDTLPDNLIYLAALLIKIGFISLVDLYPHLYPLDEDMPALKERLEKENAEREKTLKGESANNALANAGALPDDTLPPSVSRLREAESRASSKPESIADKGTPAKAEEDEKEKLPEPVDQKTHLLRSLLCIGAVPEALFILGKFPWLLDVYPDLHVYIHRLIHHSLSKIYQLAQPISTEEGICVPKRSLVDDPLSTKGQPRPTDFPPRKTLRWAQLERNDAGDGIDYRFYWDDWADNVPICQTVDDVFKLCDTLLNLLGLKFSQDGALLSKIARIGKKSVTDDPSESNKKRWIELIKRLLAPSLTFTGRNPGVVSEMFELLKCFPTETRYSIYSEWFTGPMSRHALVSKTFKEVSSETKNVLKRISKTNVKPMARALAKAAYNSPGVVFQVVLSQIESYENLSEVVIECGRYFTYLAYDCLTWALMNSLGGMDRNRVQADGMLTSQWLRALAAFAGKVYKRYNVMNPTPVLQYVGHQLLRGNSMDLEVLEQILVSMAGIRSDLVLSDSQIACMAGGELLRAHTLEFHLGDQRHLLRSTSKRLMRYMVENGLAAQLLIAIAQERQTYIFRESASDAPLKVLGNNLDRIHQIFVQYLDFLRSNLSVKDFDLAIPDVVNLISSFGIDPSIAFTICRDSITSAVEEVAARMRTEKAEKAKKAERERNARQGNQQANGDVEMAEASGVPEAPATNGESTGPVNGEMRSTPLSSESQSPADATTKALTVSEDPWNPVLKSLMDGLKPVLPSTFEENFSLSFYVTFWQLSLHDLICPSKEYEIAVAALREKMPANDNRRDVSIQAVKKREADKKYLLDEQDKIRVELKNHIQSYSEIRRRLKDEKDHWFDGFPMVEAKSEGLHDSILQECFLPRMLYSSQDAHFTFVMLKYLHSSGVPGFRTMKFLDRFFRQKQLTALIFQCTARESENLGRFMNEVLKELKLWHADRAMYLLQAVGDKQELPGFGRTFKPDRTPASFVDYEDFRRVLYKWHSQLFRALEACLNSGEYMHIRNSINILKAVNQSFPVVDFMGKGLNKVVESLSNSESRSDLKLSAQSLLGDFKKGEKTWVISQAFHIVSLDEARIRAKSSQHNKPQNKAGLNQPRNASRSNSERAITPQPSAARSLNTNGSDSAPKTHSLSNGVSKLVSTAKEVEDGEVEDERRQYAAAATTTTAQPNDKESSKPIATPSEQRLAATTSQAPEPVRSKSQSVEAKASTNPASQASPPVSIAAIPDSKGATNQSTPGRTPHALPSRPDGQPPRGRVSDRPSDRPSEYHGHTRHDVRSNPNTEYGRLDRPGENVRDPFPDRRERSPGRLVDRSVRARTPDRGPTMDRDRRDPAWPVRDSREYPDDRGMRPPPRDLRAPAGRGSGWAEGSRDSRDMRDIRDRPPMDTRAPPPPPNDNRSRMHPGAPFPPPGSSPYHGPNRDAPPNSDRSGYMPSKQSSDRTLVNSTPFDRPFQGPVLNSERAAMMEADRGRPESFRAERDGRRDRGSRPHSPRRVEERAPPTYPNRGVDAPRDHRDDRGAPPERPQQGYPPSSRDRRDDIGINTPTGPRGGRNDYPEPPLSGRTRDSRDARDPPHSRDMRDAFQSSHASRTPVDPNHGRLNQDFSLPPRPQVQDPNYGRLNATSDIPSGPRGRVNAGRGGRNFTAPPVHASSRLGDSLQIPSSPAADRPPGPPFPDRRDRRESAALEQSQLSAPSTPATEQAPQDMSGIHPSRLGKIQGPPLQTDVPPPSGPRGTQRTPHPGSGPSPTSRNPPTGPASSNERPTRRTEAQRLYPELHNVIRQPEPSGASATVDYNDGGERKLTERGATIRGRAGRPGGPNAATSVPQAPNTSSPGVSQPSTPNAARLEGLPSRLDNRPELLSIRGAQGENNSQDDGRSDSRSRREGRRSERPTRHRSSRSRSPPKGDRKGDERATRNEEPDKERPVDRERGSGREKRSGGGSDRDGGRRERGDRDRDGERLREGRERRERGLRDDSRREGGAGRGEDPGLKRGGPPMTEGDPPAWGGEGRGADVRAPDTRNGDTRMRGNGERRDDRERRDTRGDGRDGRKRGRAGDEAAHGENKRPRRTN